MYITGGIAAKNMQWIADDPSFKEVMFDKVRERECPLDAPNSV